MEVWLVNGLQADRWALVCKVHHCMVDGISGVGLLTVLLDITPEVDVGDPEPWEPSPEPNAAAKGAGHLEGARVRYCSPDSKRCCGSQSSG